MKIHKPSVISGAAVALIVFMGNAAYANAQADSIYARLLERYVRNGRVNYAELRRDAGLKSFIDSLAATDPAALPTRNAQLAFWLNAYNAYTLQLICEHYPVKSIKDIGWGGDVIGHIFKTTAWDKDFAVVGHKRFTLNEIEHSVIRSEFKDPRVHCALVCAARSCPALRAEPYNAAMLDGQLNDQARNFLADTSKNSFDAAHKTAYLSKIFDWYKGDFGGTNESVMRFISWYLPEALGQSIRANPHAWMIRYKQYDWRLNQKEK